MTKQFQNSSHNALYAVYVLFDFFDKIIGTWSH